MFISCLHCRELVALDRETRLAPEMCPRCGGALGDSSATEAPAANAPVAEGRSFISFLQGGETATARMAEAAETVAATNGGPTSLDAAPRGDADEESDGIGTGAEPIAQPASGIGQEEIGSMPSDSGDTAVRMPPAPSSATQTVPAMPSFTRQAARPDIHSRTASWQWMALVVLSLMLCLQLLLADRARLAADAAWRPLLARLCGVLGCSIPPWHQPGAFSMLSRDVSPIAGSAGGLSVQATFRNDARWAQTWPVLLLSLSDADGHVLGSRAFTPREYLGAAATQTELAPGQSAQIALKLHEPSPDVVAFTFDFR